MKKITVFIFLLILILSVNLSAKTISFKWIGHACFLVETTKGTKIIMDPISMGAYQVPDNTSVDIVTVSHEHGDHNKVEAVASKKTVIRGLKESGKAYHNVNIKFKDVKIHNVKSYHDKYKGEKRGLNSIFVFEFDSIKVVHLGDLGHILDENQIKKIGHVDVLMIPVGGKYTICSRDAEKVVEQLNPSLLVFPMHYKTESASFLPYSGEDFVKGKENIVNKNDNEYVLNLKNKPENLTYVLLNYK